MLKFFLYILLIFITIFTIFLTDYVFGADIRIFINSKDFDSEIWKNWEENDEFSPRLFMVRDLINSDILIGKNKSDLIKLLGHKNDTESNIFYYDMGMSGHGIDTAHLKIIFKNDKVVNVSWHHG